MKFFTLLGTAALSILLTRGAMATDSPVKVLATIAVQGAFVDIERMLPESADSSVMVEFAPTPVMTTTEDFIAFMKATPSMAYSAGGASGVYVAELIEKLGLSDVMKPKATVVSDGFSATLLQQGKVASAVQQVSELKFGGAKNILPFPEELRSPPVFSAAVLNNAQHADAAAKVLQVLTSSAVVAAYKRSGVSPVFK